MLDLVLYHYSAISITFTWCLAWTNFSMVLVHKKKNQGYIFKHVWLVLCMCSYQAYLMFQNALKNSSITSTV